MLKGYRGPALALVFSLMLLVAVLLTMPSGPASPTVTPLPANTVSIATRTPQPSSTPPPTLTPAPTIALSRIDIATLNEAVISPSCFLKVNPLLAGYNQSDRDAAALIFEGLMTTNEYGGAVPDLAAAQPDVSDDGLVYSFKLREDVKWHDGQPFTSADVVYTFRLLQDPAFPGPADLRRFWETVEVDAITAHIVRFKLAQPLATFPEYLRIGILPEHVLRGTTAAALPGHPFNLSPIGTGPYQFHGLIGDGQRLRGLRLVTAATYTERPEGQKPFAFRQIALRCYPTWEEAVGAFQRGEVNSLSEIPAEAVGQIKGLPLTIYPSYRPALGAVIYNWRNDQVPYFRDARMRQALARSVDRRALIDRYMGDRGVPADNPILPLSWAYAPDITCPTYDAGNPDAAKDSLSRVQITPPPPASAPGDPTPDPAVVGPAKYRFELLVANDQAHVAMAEEMKSDWNALGLVVNVTVVETATFRERLAAGTFEAALVELNYAPNADPDPYSLWRQVQREGGLNFGGLNDRVLSEIVENARRTTNGPARVALYREFQQLFCDRAAALLLYYPVYYYAADRRMAGVQLGFMAEPSDRFRTLRDWVFTGR